MLRLLPSLFAVMLTLVSLSGCTRQPELPVLSTIPPTALIDSSGAAFDLGSLKGEVWIAHFMFTRCGGPCPRMVAEFQDLQRQIGPRDGLKWVSITADPSFDSPTVMAEYASRFDADPDRWLFLTGQTEAIYTLAEKGFLLSVQESAKEEGLITHSLKFAVIDDEMKIRAYHDHFDEQNAEILTAEIDALM